MESETPPENVQLSTYTESTGESVSGQNVLPMTDSDEDGISLKKLAEKHRGPGSKKAKDKPTRRRPSRRAAMEALQQLHSESQRLIREAPVNLPYHEPKKMTLYEFLKKRNSRLLENWPTQPGSSMPTKSNAAAPSSSQTSGSSAAADGKNTHSAVPFTKPLKHAASSACKDQNDTDVHGPAASAGSDDDDLPDMDTAWKQCTSGQVPVDCRAASPTASTAVPSPSQTHGADGSTAEICHSDVIVSAKPKPTNPRLCSTRDYIRSLVPNLPKLAPVLGGKGAGTDLIDLDHPFESFEIFNRLAKHVGKCKKAVSKTAAAATLSTDRRDENGLAMFQWRSSDAGLDDTDLPPGAHRAALRQALLDRLQLRRRLELQKRREAYKQENEQRYEKSEGYAEDQEEEEEFDDAIDSEEEENDDEGEGEREADGGSTDDEAADDEKAAAIRGNPFVDDEAEDSDRADDKDSSDDSNSMHLRLDSSDDEAAEDMPLPPAQRRRRKACILDEDDDSMQLTSAAAKAENSSCLSPDNGRDSASACKRALDCDASGEAAETQATNSKAGRSFVLPVEDSQLLLGQQTCGRSPAEAAEPTQDFRMSLMESTQASNSESFLLDDEGFLRYKSPRKASTATVNSSRRRLQLVYIPEGTEAANCHDDGVMSERTFATKHMSKSPDGLITAFATNDRQSASEEAIALCSGGFSGIDRSAINSGLLATDRKCVTDNEAAPLCSDGFVTHDQMSSAQTATSSEGTARKLKRVRLWAAGDVERSDNDDSNDGLADAAVQKTPDDTRAATDKKQKFQSFLNSRKRKIRRDFVEEEAELSGSEEASDDEEVALDDNAKALLQQMAEADRDDVGTEEELRNQVGRVHMKSVLDADHKEVLLMQERFLPDGDLHSDSKRMRRFRWSKRDDTVFAGSFGDQDDSVDEKEMESEYAWRKERFEREQWLKNHAPPEDMFDFLPLRPDRDPKIDRIWKSLVSKAKADRLAKAQAPAPSRAAVQDDDPPTPSKIYNMNMKVACRGSFLAKPKEELARLAKIYGGKTINPYGAKRNGNFVFTMVSPTSAKDSKQAPDKEEPSTQPSGRRKQAFNAFTNKVNKPQSSQPGENKEPEYPKDSILAYL